MTVGTDERFVVISADCHAGGSMDTYGEYLDPAYRDDFLAWREAYRDPFHDLQSPGRTRNWDSDQRIAELETDGQVAEVVFPNTVPPFFPTGALVARPPPPPTSTSAGRVCGPTTGGWPSGAAPSRRDVPASPRSSSTTSTAPSRRRTGSRPAV